MILLHLVPLLCAPACGDLHEDVQAALSPVLEREEIPGAVVGVMMGGQWLVREAFGVADVESQRPMSTDALFQVGSVTKPVTATLLFVLASRGVVDPDTPVVELFPAVELDESWNEVTLVHLATHTAGLPRNPANRRDIPETPSVMLPYSIAELLEALPDTRIDRTPGETWSYSNYGYALLGHALEVAAGEPLADLFAKHVLDPLDMENSGAHPGRELAKRMPSGYWPEDDEPIARAPWEFGEVWAFAGLHTDLDDLGRFLTAQIHPPQDFAAPEQMARMHRAVVDVDARAGRSMAPGWFRQALPGGLTVLGHGGEVDGHSAAIGFIAEMDLAFITLANRGGSSAEELARALLQSVMTNLSAEK